MFNYYEGREENTTYLAMSDKRKLSRNVGVTRPVYLTSGKTLHMYQEKAIFMTIYGSSSDKL